MHDSLLIHNRDEWVALYEPTISGLARLLDEQHGRVEQKGRSIAYAVWVGQFSDSDMVRKTGQEIMDKWPTKPNYIHEKGTS